MMRVLLKTMQVCTCCGLRLKQLVERTKEQILNRIVRMRNGGAQDHKEIQQLLADLKELNSRGYDVDVFTVLVRR